MIELSIREVLPLLAPDVTVLTMYTLGRVLQFVGLAIPPLAIVAELNDRNPTMLLKFLGVSVGFFMLGYLMQRYSGRGAE